MSLYLKYRPSELEEVKGNADIIAALEKMLSNPAKCPHSFLLFGPTGTGKTTLARIIAARLGCPPITENAEQNFDYNEVNASDINGVDLIRDIIRKCDLRPMQSDCKVYVMDEAQRLTKDAQNALLKILEDTPKHVYFILCTTDPQKLLPTIKGRCSSFQTKVLNDIQMKGLLRRVSRAEGQSLATEVMDSIIRDSLGHPRNALQILEQVLSVDEEQQLEIAQQTAIVQSQSIELCRALINRKGWKEVRIILAGLTDQEPEQVRRHVLGYCQAVLLKDDVPLAGLIMEEMLPNTYDSGWSQIIYAAYSITKNH